MATKTKKQYFSYEGVVEVNAHRISFWFKGTSTIEDDSERNELLNEEAEYRAKSMTSGGYTSGVLNFESETINARGWWSIEKS